MKKDVGQRAGFRRDKRIVDAISVTTRYEPDIVRCAKALLVLLDRPSAVKNAAQIDPRGSNLAEPHASPLQGANVDQHKS